MFRECAALLVLAMASGCSLILDFDSALPADASIDGVSTMTECAYGEPNNTPADAKDITAADMGPAGVCGGPNDPEDDDWYRFMATGAPATIEINFVNRVGGDLDLRVFTMDGTMISQSRTFNDNEKIVCPGASPPCPALMAAPYLIEVLPGVANAVNTYTFRVTQ